MKKFGKKSERGVGLIEVMVTVLILGTSLLAIAALQVRSLDQNHNAYLRTQANILAYDYLERVRAASPQPPGGLQFPDSEDFNTMVARVLPNGNADIDCDNRLCTVTITWTETAGTDAGGETSTFTYTTSF